MSKTNPGESDDVPEISMQQWHVDDVLSVFSEYRAFDGFVFSPESHDDRGLFFLTCCELYAFLHAKECYDPDKLFLDTIQDVRGLILLRDFVGARSEIQRALEGLHSKLPGATMMKDIVGAVTQSLLDGDEVSIEPSGGMKTCPSCGSQIPSEADICPVCDYYRFDRED